MAEAKWTFEECDDPRVGCKVLRNGEEIYRTSIATMEPKRHDNAAKALVDQMNLWEKSRKATSGGGGTSTQRSGGNADWDCAWMEDILARASRSNALNDFERKFVESTQERYEQYGARMFMSERQHKIMTDIEDVLTNGRTER